MTDLSHEQLVAAARAQIVARRVPPDVGRDACSRAAGRIAHTPPADTPPLTRTWTGTATATLATRVARLEACHARDEDRNARENRKVFWILVAMVTLMFASAAVFTMQQARLADVGKQNRALVTQLAAIVEQIQTERRRNTLLSCRGEDRANATLRGFFIGLIPPERRRDPQVLAFLARAARAFPRLDCRRQARQRVQSTRR